MRGSIQPKPVVRLEAEQQLKPRNAGEHPMPLTVKYEDRKDYLYALVEGAYDFESTIQSYTGILETGANRHAVRVVIDARTATGGPSVIERYEIVTAAIHKYYDLIQTPGYVGCRFAMVGQAPLLDVRHFCETVANNGGLILKDFETMDEALEWIGLKR
jgi:hypothetical protein